MPVASTSTAHPNATSGQVAAGPYVIQFHEQARGFAQFGVEKQAKGIKVLTSVLAREVLGGGNLGALLAAQRGIDRLSSCVTLGAEVMYKRHAASNLSADQSELLKTGIICHLNTLCRNVVMKAAAKGAENPKKYNAVLNDVELARGVLLELKAEKPAKFPTEPCILTDLKPD
ncbi:MAG: hypothetical protein LW629_13060 [Burkholderiales bacterium]|jgi:hypothetical protein|nr:hypothetical protein [Burkholderiales bacterium]